MNKIFDSFTLKMIAIVGMILQHTAMILEEFIPFALEVPMHLAGGLTFPIMAFFLIEGYKHTSNVKSYIGRLLIFAVLSQVPYLFAYQVPTLIYPLNIMFILSLGLIMIHLHEVMTSRGLFWFLFVIFLLLSFTMEWGLIGLVMILMYKTIKNEKSRRFWPPTMAAIINVVLGLIGMGSVALLDLMGNVPELAAYTQLDFDISVQSFSLVVFFGLGSLIAALLLPQYNGKRGRNMQYFFYVIYPLHFFILGMIVSFLT